MSQRYVASKIPVNIMAGDWYVREMHPDGQSAQIMCYCPGEQRAKEIAACLNVVDAINSLLNGQRT